MTPRRHRRRPLAAVLGTIALLAAPAAARGGTVSLDGGTLRFTAAPGEVNSVFYGHDYGNPDSTVTLGDDTMPAIAGGACEPQRDQVVCSGVTRVVIDLGDRDDWGFAGAGDDFNLPVEIHGGPGNDQFKATEHGASAAALFGDDGNDELNGGPNADVLHGGAGNDTLDGYGGPDQLFGEDGDDTLDGDTYAVAAPDLIDGGAGTDRADAWTGPTPNDHPPLDITMDGVANDGRPGEGDNVVNIEKMVQPSSGRFVFTDAADSIAVYANTDMGASRIEARGGNDTIQTGNFDETIDAGAGDDRIDAGYGNDTIMGGPGRDTIYADKAGSDCGVLQSCSLPQGNDTVYAVDGEVDTISCGVGTDTVYADPIDTVSPDCENVDRSGKVTSPGSPGNAGPGAPAGDTPGADLPRPRCSATARRSGGRIAISGKVSLRGTKLRGTRLTLELRSGKRTLRTAHAKVGRSGRFSATLKPKAPASNPSASPSTAPLPRPSARRRSASTERRPRPAAPGELAVAMATAAPRERLGQARPGRVPASGPT